MFHTCPYCNTEFTANRKDKIYCSHSCKQMAFMKRQEDSVGFVFQKYQNVNTINRQVIEASSSQTVKSSMDTIDIEKLKKEIVAFAKVAIQNKLDELIQNIKTSNFQNVNNFNTANVNSDLDLFCDKQATVIDFQDDENDRNVNIKKETSIKEQTLKPSIPNIDGLNRNVLKTETVKPTILIEEEVYTPIKCKWINELYERFNERGNDEKLNFPAPVFKDKMNQVEWVSTHYRCLLECVITISEIKTVEWADLAELTNAFTFLLTTTYFKELPDSYPFTKDIISLRDKLKYFCLETQDEELVQFRLKFDTKKELLLQRFELSLVFPKISFNQLQSDFKNESDKQINFKKERDIKYSMEEKPWQKKFKELKLNRQSAKKYNE